jgi:hypothetical protein
MKKFTNVKRSSLIEIMCRASNQSLSCDKRTNLSSQSSDNKTCFITLPKGVKVIKLFFFVCDTAQNKLGCLRRRHDTLHNDIQLNNIMTFSRAKNATLRIMAFSAYAECCYVLVPFILSVII